MPSAPSAPDVTPASTQIAAQQSANTQSGNQNLVAGAQNQNNPYSSLSYSFGTGPNGEMQLTANQSYTPQQQALLDQMQGNQQQAGQQAGSALASGQYGNVGNLNDYLNNQQSGIVQQNLGNYVAQLQPYFTQQSNSLDNQLRNQGLTPGTQAYTDAMNNLSQSQNQSVSGYLSQAEPQAAQQALSQYQAPANLYTQLMSGSGPQSLNSVSNPNANYGNTNALGAYQNQTNAEQQQYQNEVNQSNATWSGIGQLAGIAAAPFTGGLSLGATGALSGMFGSTTPGTAANGGWSTTTTPNYF